MDLPEVRREIGAAIYVLLEMRDGQGMNRFMKGLFSLLAGALLAGTATAADVGLYDMSDASHPRLLRDKIEKVTISSDSNDNKQYYLNIDARDSFSVGSAKIGLVVGNNTIRFNSAGYDRQGNCGSVQTTIDDPEIIPDIAQYFHATVLKRHHPGEQMLVQFVPDKAAFKAGEPVVVKLHITNVGNKDFAFMEGGRQRGARDNQFAFSAEVVGPKIVGGKMKGEMLPDTGDPMNFGGLAFPVVLKTGQSHDVPVDLTEWFRFEKHGSYNIRGSYYMEFINPGDRDLFTIWDDYACAEFTITME